MYVDGPDETRYIVDRAGKAYEIADDELLLRQVVGDNRKPQRVSAAWLDTLHEGDPVDFPTIDGTPGIEAGVGGDLDPELDKVGTILKATDGTKSRHYVVLEGRVAPISDFTAKLLLSSRDLIEVGQDGEATSVSAATFRPDAPFGQDKDWPQSSPDAVNSASTSEGSRNTVCSVLREVDADSGDTTLTTWAGTGFPATLATGATSAYVTPGSGQLFRQFTGGTTKSGFLFLVTDTGLRYAMQSNGDSATDDSGIGESGSEKEKQASRDEVQKAQNRLGYQNVDAAPVPAAWSSFLPTGPRLSTGAAGQPQGS